MNTLKGATIHDKEYLSKTPNERNDHRLNTGGNDSEDNDHRPKYASDGFAVMQKNFENSLQNPALNVDLDEEVKPMSRTAEFSNSRGQI